MTILALDLGARTGWAVWDGRRVESGVQVFDVKRGESPGMRFHRFNRWLAEWATTVGAGDLVVWEAPHHRGGAATELAVGMATRVMEWAAVHRLEHASVHSATLKKWVTGNGRASKEDMIGTVLGHGWTPVALTGLDDNEADAVALLHFARAELVAA